MVDQPKSMNEFEQRVMEMLLAGDHLYLGTLRVQLDAAAVTAREHTGVGFFTSFAVPDDCLRLPAAQGRCTISDVFDEAYRPYRFRIPRLADCLICRTEPGPGSSEDLDVALDQALARLGNA